MMSLRIQTALFVIAAMLNFSFCFAQEGINEKHIQVAMRMIGHQILLNSGDSSSLVLPITKANDRYSIQFENELQLNPEVLVATIDSVVRQAGIAKSYIVEVVECTSHKVVYSYEIGNSVKNDLVPCIKRILPEACYRIQLILLEQESWINSLHALPSKSGKATMKAEGNSYLFPTLIVIGLLLLTSLWLYFHKKQSPVKPDPNIIPVGDYLFNSKSMELRFQNEVSELSSKEADLLTLLLSSANSTVEREYILKTVWGDEGSYIGRTLDVFISKLRKKLEGDANVKIVNVRGIGYKLVLKG
ncbi:hypothetical protein GCM10011506_06840 [Marivirga lumbricoides]|uniref:OmpR/PhoB-type domain-containing protein n=1 Tax=Marivirga lumbricoides TaxID=1046115 RepID=A0ABQ1LJD2_9BACT|nr:hypothetical protein GCM10011506_06840 [Marivirga lumbricoides]